ncbi:N-6 DNA methylase, partial [Candidatus Pseudothioglobus singularis]|nr:N-6 DNA methylase [Candidatus Pseudothioglobus singularis]
MKNIAFNGKPIDELINETAWNERYGKRINDAYKAFIEEYYASHGDISDEDLIAARGLAREFIKTGLLSKTKIIDEFAAWFNSFSNHQSGNYVIPKEISDFLIGLAEITNDDDVCIEWDFGAQLGIRASETASKVVLETPLKSCIPLFIDLLTESNIAFEFCDPIISPSGVSSSGELPRYDVTISHPPFGLKGEIYNKAVEGDWFNRFPEKTRQGTILAIQHLLSITKRMGVIAVQDSILFSPGAEYKLRQDLINKGVVQTVIAMPNSLMPQTNIGFSILLLTPSKKNNSVNFIDLRSSHFYSGNGRVKILNNLEDIIRTLADLKIQRKNDDSEYVKNISNSEIESNNFNLSPSKYVLSEDIQSVNKILADKQTVSLGRLIKVIRPRVHRVGVDSGLEVLEIGAADIPDRAFIVNPSKAVLLGDVMPNDNYAKPNDIVLIVKGSAGKVGILSSSVPEHGKGGWVIGQSAIILRVESDEIDPHSLFTYLRSNIGQSLLKNITADSTIPFIKLSDLKELQVVIPEANQKEKISKTLKREDDISKQIKKLQKEQLDLSKDVWNI